ncbi:hypothetical protein [Caballeronia sp. RCC_10]|uniref:hypothetical protein n=1 Tax=Caballeronia sp. RCC_10 TaxID=3239227 RepID=UPI00352419C7
MEEATAGAGCRCVRSSDEIVKMRMEVAAANKKYSQKVAAAKKVFDHKKAEAAKERDAAIEAAHGGASGQ